MEPIKSFQDFDNIVKKVKEAIDPESPTIRICMTGCLAFGAEEIRDEMVRQLDKRGLTEKVRIIETGCFGLCSKAPVIALGPKDIFYQQVKKEDVPLIIEKTILHDEIIPHLLYTHPETGEKYTYLKGVPFFKAQEKRVLENCGQINPKEIIHYLIRDGYLGLKKALQELSPEEIIDSVKRSGLRGRGGGGFLTGLKWEFCREAFGRPKYLICNADEGDPGAFMDRGLLEGDPHSVLEGMLIAAYAIGAEYGYVYVRAEYPIAIRHLKIAIDQAREFGLIGDRIMGTDFSFNLQIKEGAGAFVCGEETALIASIEGRRGMPRSRPPFPVHHGVWGKPTNINNVETFANVPLIIREGAEAYSKVGTTKSKGTKVFALAGNITNTGLVEVPLGASLRDVIFGIGGGIPNEKKFKAVQLGGPSGGCIPDQYLDTPIDYDSLQELGAIMGSGGMIVMDEDTCMVDIAHYFLSFVQSESCGKCIPCRIGIKRMLEVLVKITKGMGEMSDIDLLGELAVHIKITALCGLGQTAPNPVLSTLKYFREEFEAHIRDKTCPAKVCKSLIIYSIQEAKCTGCGVCKKACPVQAVKGTKKSPHMIEQALCIKCGACFEKCKFGAVLIISKEEIKDSIKYLTK
jgi:NADH:ubiquinone oxidoreductase subunit F (NADH-binding)/(2Fe-2S) ferredoxin